MHRSTWFRPAALSLVFPQLCPCCGLEEDRGVGLCEACESKIPNHLRPFRSPDLIRSAWALDSYRGPLGALVRVGKYASRPHLFDLLGRRLAAVSLGRLPPVDLICGVPSHWTRRFFRGFEPTALLVRPVADRSNLPIAELIAGSRRAVQASLSENRRRRSAGQNFFSPPIDGHRVLLVDDVCTTGSTATACAEALLTAGAVRVDLLCVVRTGLAFGDGSVTSGFRGMTESDPTVY